MTRENTQNDLDRPPMPKVSTIIGTIMLLVTMGTLVWGMSAIVSSKADKEIVYKIQTDVEVIKTRQEMFIRAVRPGLPIGKE
jgi:hypothetical protein